MQKIMSMIKNILVFLILFSFTSIIQASESNARQQNPFDFYHYQNQRQQVSLRDHNTFSTTIQKWQDKDFNVIEQELHNEREKIMECICKEKQHLLEQFKQEFNIPDHKWNAYINLNTALLISNNTNRHVPLQSFHDPHISNEHIAIMKAELEYLKINPKRINIFPANDTQKATFRCPCYDFIIEDDTIEITSSAKPGSIILPTQYDYNNPLFILFCRISAYALWFNNALEWEIMPFLFSFFNINEETYYQSKTYQAAIPTFTSNSLLSMAFTGPKNAEALLDYTMNYHIPHVTLQDFAKLSKI